MKKLLGPYIVGSAIIWGAMLLGASMLMRGWDGGPKVMSLLGAGTAIHLVLIWGPLAASYAKLMKSRDAEQSEA